MPSILLPEQVALLEVQISAIQSKNLTPLAPARSTTVALLQDVLSRAQSQIKVNTQGGVNAIKTGVKNQVQTKINDVVNGVSNTAGDVIGAGVKGVTSAAADLFKGNVGGALGDLAGIPGNIANAAGRGINNALGAFGITSGSTLSGGIDYLSVSSGPGDVSYGNALAGIMARADPMHAFNWFADLPQINAGGFAASLPWYYVEEATIPFRQFESRNVYREGRFKHYPGKYSVDSLRLSVYLDSDNVALNYWQTWQNAILQPFNKSTMYSLGGGYTPPSSFKKDINIYLLDVRRAEVMSITYIECWPTSFDSLHLQSASGERLIGQVTLNVGDVFVNMMNLGSGLISGVSSLFSRPSNSPTSGFSVTSTPSWATDNPRLSDLPIAIQQAQANA
jgi:hypothetical protein